VVNFGGDRCKSGGKVIDGLANGILKNSSATDIATNIWHTLNITEEDGVKLARILKLDEEDYLTPVIQGAHDYIGPAPGQSDLYDVTFKSYDKSYMVSFFNFKEDSFIFNLYYLLAMVVASKLAVWFILTIKSKVKRL